MHKLFGTGKDGIGQRRFVFSSKTTIAVDNSAQQSDVASQLAGLFEQSAGFVPKFVDDVSQADVAFVTDLL